MRKVFAGMLAAAVLVSVCSATAIVSARCGHHGGAAGSRVRQETFCHFTDTDGDGICDSCQFVWDADRGGVCDHSAYCGAGYGSGDYGVSGCGTGNGYRRGHHCR